LVITYPHIAEFSSFRLFVITKIQNRKIAPPISFEFTRDFFLPNERANFSSFGTQIFQKNLRAEAGSKSKGRAGSEFAIWILVKKSSNLVQ